MYNIAIIGAGPAGATLARLLADRYKVLLVDKRRLTTDSDGKSSVKCCGGLLAPDAQGMLSKMGLGLPKSVLVERNDSDCVEFIPILCSELTEAWS